MPDAKLTVIGAWVVAFCAIAGLGQLVRRAFRLSRSDSADWFLAFWIGYTLLIGGLAIWHLVLPIDWRTTLVFGIPGLIGFVLGIRQRKAAPAADQPLRPRWRSIAATVVTLLLLIPIAIWIVSRALDSQLDFDTGMYHLSTIHWLNVYPAVPGLGNLHYRLAFNQSFFTFVAALNVYPYFDQGFHVANSLLMIVLIAQLLRGLIDALLTQPISPQFQADRWAGALLLPVALYRATREPYSANMSSASPDLSIFILQIVAFLAFVRLLFIPASDSRLRSFLTFYVIGVSVVGVTSKLSFAAFGLSLIVLTILAWLWPSIRALSTRRADPSETTDPPDDSHLRRTAAFHAIRSVAFWLIIIGVTVGLPWMVEGIIASGYPLFPSTVGALPVDYRVPAPIATDAADWVRSFARDPHGDEQTVLNSWDWLPTWQGMMEDSFDRFLFATPLYIFLGGLALFAVLFLIVEGALFRFRRHFYYRALIPLIPAALSAIFWFWSAPDPRFAGSSFWLLAVWALILLIFIAPASIPHWLDWPLLVAPLITALAVVAANFSSDASLTPGSFPRLPVAPIALYVTNSGLVVNISGNPNDTLELWDAPLPASPYKLPDLELRGTDLKDGFRMADSP